MFLMSSLLGWLNTVSSTFAPRQLTFFPSINLTLSSSLNAEDIKRKGRVKRDVDAPITPNERSMSESRIVFKFESDSSRTTEFPRFDLLSGAIEPKMKFSFFSISVEAVPHVASRVYKVDD